MCICRGPLPFGRKSDHQFARGRTKQANCGSSPPALPPVLVHQPRTVGWPIHACTNEFGVLLFIVEEDL